MGKTTLYHPVSLQTIRGALDQCGVKCGRIHQTDSSVGKGQAWYDIDIIKTPKSLDDLPFKQWAKAFQDCFASDITVIDLSAKLVARKRAFTIKLSIYVTLYSDTPLEKYIDAIKIKTEDIGDALDLFANDEGEVDIDQLNQYTNESKQTLQSIADDLSWLDDNRILDEQLNAKLRLMAVSETTDSENPF